MTVLLHHDGMMVALSVEMFLEMPHSGGVCGRSEVVLHFMIACMLVSLAWLLRACHECC